MDVKEILKEQVEMLEREIAELEGDIAPTERKIRKNMEQIQKLQERIKKLKEKNDKLNAQIREKRTSIKAKREELKRLQKALAVLEGTTKKRGAGSKPRIQKYVVVEVKGKKVVEKREFRAYSQLAKYFYEFTANKTFLSAKNIDDIIKTFREAFPYQQIKESKTVMYFYVPAEL